MGITNFGGYKQLKELTERAEELRKSGLDEYYDDKTPLSRAEDFPVSVVPGVYELHEARLEATAASTEGVVPVIVLVRFSINDTGMFFVSRLGPVEGVDYTDKQATAFAAAQAVTSLSTWIYRKEPLMKAKFDGFRKFPDILDYHLWDIEKMVEGVQIEVDKTMED